jgi:SAM-dependent methyltransferase
VARKLKIGRAVYLVDDDRRTYSFLERNPDWARLSPRQNAANKLQIDGYVRLFRDGRKKTFRAGRTPSPKASPRSASAPPKLYAELASWFHLLTSPADYAEEAEFYIRTLTSAAHIPLQSVLELGSGGGNNASHMKAHFRMTLIDRSASMLVASRGLNPECEHMRGDMRSVRLRRLFDGVFLHDAVAYMTTIEDLHKAAVTAFVHCRPGGAALFAPDAVRETFRASTSHGGHDGDGRSLRYLEWTWDPDPVDTSYVTEYVYLLKADGHPVRAVSDHHELGLFARSEWLSVLRQAGFEAWSVPFAHSEISDGPLDVFVGIRPMMHRALES